MTFRREIRPALFLSLSCLAALACPTPDPDGSEPPPGEPAQEENLLGGALTFHASFDEGTDADFALGDPEIYTAPSWGERDQAEPGLWSDDVEIVPNQGRFGGALRFNRRNTAAIFYRADEKVAYSEDDWSGTVSFWLSLSPSEDLEPGYCDPIQITDQAYNDAAVWVDFTSANPRQFRLGVFGDLDAWNPEGLSSDEHPNFQDKLVVVEELPFRRGEWTHVVVAYSGLGSVSGGAARLYLDGHLQGTIADIREPFSWDLLRAQVRIGVNYVGLFDELAMFDRPLTDSEVLSLHQLEGGVAALHS
ncbi:LamG-like jellyroll fold domain-containing protein [Gemmatimonadota bacterium]